MLPASTISPEPSGTCAVRVVSCGGGAPRMWWAYGTETLDSPTVPAPPAASQEWGWLSWILAWHAPSLGRVRDAVPAFGVATRHRCNIPGSNPEIFNDFRTFKEKGTGPSVGIFIFPLRTMNRDIYTDPPGDSNVENYPRGKEPGPICVRCIRQGGGVTAKKIEEEL